MPFGRDLGDRPWSFDLRLLEVAETWDQVGVLAVSYVQCAGPMGILGRVEGREMTSGWVAGLAVNDPCYKKRQVCTTCLSPCTAVLRHKAAPALWGLS